MRPSKFLVWVFLLALAGCSFNTYQIGAPLQTWEPDPNGVTRLSEALAELGPPLKLSALPGGYALAWESWHIKERKLGVSLSFIGADYISVDWGRARNLGEFLILIFDREHLLVSSRYDSWDSDLGGGQALQALTSVVDVVDVDDLRRPLPYHRWGAFTLSELPVALNRESSIDTGESGLEQRGTPGTVGQRSLEMGQGED